MRSEEIGYGQELYSGYQEKRVMGATMHGPGPRRMRVMTVKGALPPPLLPAIYPLLSIP